MLLSDQLLNGVIALIILIVIFIILKIYKSSFFSKDYQNKFLYLNLKTSNKTIKELKEKTYTNIKNTFYVSAVFIAISASLPTYMASAIMFIILFLFMIICTVIVEKSVRKIKNLKLDLNDNTSKVKLGGLYYYNKDDKEDYIDGMVGSTILNLARPFAKKMIIITIFVTLITVLAFAFI
ncbi:hypothetical protein [Mycoplasma sp. P36-A1]|uniref:hypothetical protein n=1 Tax=Mycoplasma sp. P36-A1 TaxID=3252900 RepID=UPI003C2AB0FB